MTILDTPKEFEEVEMVDYLRHIIDEIEAGNISLADLNWRVISHNYPLAEVIMEITLQQMILGKERRRVSDNKP